MRTRAHFPTSLLALLLLTLAFATSLGPSATQAQSSPADQLLEQAVTSMSQLESFGFELNTVQGRSTIMSALELKTVKGAVERPDSFRAEATVKVAVAELTVKAVGKDGRIWVTDPTKSEETYVEVSMGDAESNVLSALLNPDELLLRAIEYIQDPKIDGKEEINGVEAVRITGTFDPNEALAAGGIGTPTSGSAADFLVLKAMPIWLWIDNSGHLVRMEIVGAITTSESDDVVRRLDLFDFDQPADITIPV